LRCPSCAHDNEDDAQFCDQCGADFAPVCPACKAENKVGARFCRKCRAPLAGAEAAPPAGTSTPKPAPALPASFAGGRYVVKGFLGEGGRKKVYLAHDTKLDRDVAVAIIKTEGLDEAGLSRVQREAQAMGRLGDHPNIVTIHDVGDDAGQPYIVSQYMSGGAVDGLGLPLPADRTLDIAKGVCRGLAHAHTHNVIHRDLKPGNVWLAGDGTAKIGDFGLAVALEQSRLTMQGMLVGTVAYMPPEQALGNEITPRADLYSLGCMLYEMVTGRPPFVSDNATAVISQHINTRPVAPSWHTESCPQALEEIVLRLLEKKPEDRFASASDVLAALDVVDPGQKAASHSESNVLDRLALGVFVGREQELARLRKAFDSAVAGHGGLVMLVGEPGIGKTRTTQELETYARMRGAQVLWGRTHEAAGAPPYWPWLQAGEQYALAHADDLAEVVGVNMPPGAANELTRIFPWLRGQPNIGEPEPQSDPEVSQFRLFDAYASYIRAIAMNAPLVIALDDLHWADKPTLMMLQHIARELSRMPVLIIGNYRDTDINRQSALSETLATLNRETGFERILLRGLTRDEVGAYIRARANVEPRPEVLNKIFEETEGNAFFLSEVVNLMAQEGTLTKESISDIAIPDGVREALGRRLNRLREETNELLQVAAIIGRDFTYDTLTLLGDRDEDELLKLIEEALDARVIEETETAGRYRFTHAQMQETLLAELSTTRRVRLHGQVGEALEKRYGARAEERAGRLAMHFSEAATLSPRFSEKAARYSAIAGRQALAQSAYPEAARHFRDALAAREGQDIDDDMAELLVDLGTAAIVSADVSEAWRSLRTAFSYYHQKGDSHRAADVAYLSITNYVLLRPSQMRLVEQALDMVEEGSEDYARLQVALGASAGMMGNIDIAREAFRRADEVSQKLGLRQVEMEMTVHAQIVAMFQRQFEESIELGKRAIALAQELNAPYFQGGAQFFSAAVQYYSGHVEIAEEHVAATLALAERTRQPYQIASAATCRGVASFAVGDWAASREASEWGMESLPYDARLNANSAYVAYQAGDLERGDSFRRRVAEIAATVPPGPSAEHVYMTSVPARAAQITGRHPDAAAIRASSMAVLASPVPGTPLFKGMVHIALSLVAHMTADRDAAAELLPLVEAKGSWVPDFHCHSDHVRGLLLETLDRLDDAIDAIEAALEWLPPAYRPASAEASYDCARLRLKRDAPGDHERARVLIDESLAESQALGMKPLVERILALKLEDQGIGTSTDIYTSIDQVAKAVQSEHPDLRKQAAPDGTVTIMFSDIEGSTAMADRLGDKRFMEVLREHNAIIREQVKAHGGFEVKSEGDGFMVAFQSAGKALTCASAIQKALLARNDSAAEPVRVRMGLHAGEVIKEGEDFFGRNVIMAARVASQANGGEILTSGVVKALLSGSDVAWGETRTVELKGLSGEHEIWVVEWSQA
jgi:class 3 adenylate cyclase/Cdc6-like AAA superfamily ATPase